VFDATGFGVADIDVMVGAEAEAMTCNVVDPEAAAEPFDTDTPIKQLVAEFGAVNTADGPVDETRVAQLETKV
jgi:hypothetical protein